MAQRYGGDYSPGDDGRIRPTDVPRTPKGPGPRGGAAGPRPGGAPRPHPSAWAGRKRVRGAGRVNLLFFAPAPLLLTAFGGTPAELLARLSAFGMLELAAVLTREGMAAQRAYDARRTARRPALPRKILGAAATGAGLALAGLPTGDALTPAILGLLGVVLHLMAFGPDPLRDKGAPGMDAFQASRVARAVDEAEAHLSDMRAAAERSGDRTAPARVDRFAATARRMFRTVEGDPRDLAAARRWMGVYLLGARDATARFADLHARRPDGSVRDDWLALLDDLEQGFAARTETLMLDDRNALDIEIEVLRDRLAREGVIDDTSTRDSKG